MRIESSTKTLNDKLGRCIRSLGGVSSIEEIVALNNYIFNLFDAIEAMGGVHNKYASDTISSSIKSPRNYRKKLDIYSKGLLEDYIRNDDFHKTMISDIYSYLEEVVDNIYSGILTNNTVLSHEDFEMIMFDFFKKYHLEEFFRNFFSEKPIFNNRYSLEDNMGGFCTYNPVIKDCDVFISDFDYTIRSLFAFAHECGHVYDLLNFNGDIRQFNIYFYMTFYNEVISKLFEKLFLRYLIENNILKKDAISQFECNIIDNYDFFVGSYIFSLLDDETILSKKYSTLNPEQLFNLVKRHFTDEDDIKAFLSDFDVSSFYEPFTYAYGDIISMFLSDVVYEDGFSNEIVKEFMSIRGSVFNPEFFEKHGFNGNHYIKQLEKQYKLIKK